MGKKYMRLFERKAYIIKGILHINRFTILSETLWFVRDTCQMMSVNIMSRARSPALSDFGTSIGLHDQRNLEWPFKSVLSNSQSQCREYRIRKWFLTNFAE